MAKCDEGYLCCVCGDDVEKITDSDLYLRFVIGLLDPELLHDFSKENLDPEYVAQREALVTRGWHRLKELKALGEVSILEFPLPEVIETLQQKKS